MQDLKETHQGMSRGLD